MTNNLCVRFVKAASGAIDTSHFAVSHEAAPNAEPGDIVVQNAFVSLDPYQRRQMMPNVAYANPLNLGDVMVGRAIGQVVESKHADFKAGDWALGHFGWQKYTKIKASGAEKINLDGFSASTYLGASRSWAIRFVSIIVTRTSNNCSRKRRLTALTLTLKTSAVQSLIAYLNVSMIFRGSRYAE